MKYKTNMKKEKKNYESPQLTVVEFRVERGFAASDTDPQNYVMGASQAINDYLDAEMAMRVANQDASGNVIASDMARNEDHTNDGGSSNWQYSNGGWF
jgi:hypothetical protein